MEILLVSKDRGRVRRITIGWFTITLVCALFAVSGTALFYSGAQFAAERAAQVTGSSPYDVVLDWHRERLYQRHKIDDMRRMIDANLDALGARLGQLQAHVTRLNTLGARLAKMAHLGDDFNFSSVPPIGGPVDPASLKTIPMSDLIAQLQQLSRELDDRGDQLEAMETLLTGRRLQKQVFPAGEPVRSGYISSGYGRRTDPISGKIEFHEGIDFAGHFGEPVRAVAAGVVTWADKRTGYGNIVEINHGNGYVTRYAHNKKNLVHIGETVKKGQVIALMGSTGRSTGPHVHFEVVKNGIVVNPDGYIHPVE